METNGNGVVGKRSDFIRRPQDEYPTPSEALEPLLPFLDPSKVFLDPCASAPSAIAKALTAKGFTCGWRGLPFDARSERYRHDVDFFITNPPWTWKVLEPIILNLSNQHPTWMLLSADLAHNKHLGPHLSRLRTIVSVGRVKWIPDSPYTGKDNAAWYEFGFPREEPTLFWGRGR